MKKISFDQNIKLKKKEKKLAEIIAMPIALILIILFYIIKITSKGLYKVKMQLTKLSIVLFVLYSLFSFFQQVAYAPEADASEHRLIVVMTPDEKSDWESMKTMAKRLAPLYGYPSKVIISQMALESARGTSHYCKTRNNCFGIGAYDSNPDSAFTYENKEQAIIDYMRLIQKRYPEAYALRDNPDAMIVAIKESGYASDTNYVQKIKALPEWREE